MLPAPTPALRNPILVYASQPCEWAFHKVVRYLTARTRNVKGVRSPGNRRLRFVVPGSSDLAQGFAVARIAERMVTARNENNRSVARAKRSVNDGIRARVPRDAHRHGGVIGECFASAVDEALVGAPGERT